MRSLILLLGLGCSCVWAVTGTVLVVERDDAGGKSGAAVFLRWNSGLHMDRLTTFPLPPGASYGFAFHHPSSRGEGYLFQTSATRLARNVQAFHLVPGKLLIPTKRWPDFAIFGTTLFSESEAIAWDDVQEALVIVRPDSFEQVTPSKFLGLSDPLHDVTLGRVGKNEILLLGHVGAKPPAAPYPADYHLWRITLRPNGGADKQLVHVLTKKVPYVPSLLTGAGVHYVSADRKGQFVQFYSDRVIVNWNAAFQKVSVPHGETIVPLGLAGQYGRGEEVYMAIGDDLCIVNQMGQRVSCINGFFGEHVLGVATRRNNSHGTPKHRFLTVSPAFSTDYLETYATLFQQTGKADPKSDEGRRVANYRGTLQLRLKLLLGAEPGEEIRVADLAAALNQRPSDSLWLALLLDELTPGQRDALNIVKRGMYYAASATGVTANQKLLLDSLAGVGKCQDILASTP